MGERGIRKDGGGEQRGGWGWDLCICQPTAQVSASVPPQDRCLERERERDEANLQIYY